MNHFKQLRLECAKCGKNYGQCKDCEIYKILNTPCAYCGKIGGVHSFAKFTKRGIGVVDACPECMEKWC